MPIGGLLGTRAQLAGMTTRLSNHTLGVLKTFGMPPGAMRGVPFDRRAEALLANCDDDRKSMAGKHLPKCPPLNELALPLDANFLPPETPLRQFPPALRHDRKLRHPAL